MKTKIDCKRCGGSGKFAFNPLDGNKCYGCNGSGFQMVDLVAVAKNRAAAEKRFAAEAHKREAHKLAMAAVVAEFGAAHGIDASSPLGLDTLNFTVAKATGKTLLEHCRERMA